VIPVEHEAPEHALPQIYERIREWSIAEGSRYSYK